MDFSSSANDNNKNLTAIMKPKQKFLNHFMNQVWDGFYIVNNSLLKVQDQQNSNYKTSCNNN